MLFSTGRGSYANIDQVYAVIPAGGNLARRLKKICQEQNIYYSLTGGNGSTRSLLIFNNGMVMGSSMRPETLSNHANTALAILEAEKILRRQEIMKLKNNEPDEALDGLDEEFDDEDMYEEAEEEDD